MRKLIAAVLVPLALFAAVAITAASADAGKVKPHLVKTTAAIDDAFDKNTWKFKGHVSSKNPKCLARRKVTIVATAPRAGRGVITQPPAEGTTRKDGTFLVDTHSALLLVAPYVAEVAKRTTKSGLTCSSAVSPPFVVG